MSTVIASTLLAALTIALALLTRSFLRLVGENKRLLDGNQSLSKQYFKTLEEFNNADLIYTTYFKDVFKMSDKREELIEYFRSEMELVYKRSTIGEKGNNTELYTTQEKLDDQTCGTIRHIVRPWMPEIDKLAGEYYKKYAAPNKSEKQSDQIADMHEQRTAQEGKDQKYSGSENMTRLDQFKELWKGVSPDAQTELYSLLWSFPESTLSLIVKTVEAHAAELGVMLSKEEVRGFLRSMEDEGMFVDIEAAAERLLRNSGDRRNNAWRTKPIENEKTQ